MGNLRTFFWFFFPPLVFAVLVSWFIWPIGVALAVGAAIGIFIGGFIIATGIAMAIG